MADEKNEKMKRVNISIRRDQWERVREKEGINLSGKVREMIDGMIKRNEL